VLGLSHHAQQLIHTTSAHLPISDIFHLLLDPSSNPTAVCDGSVLMSQGTFGWVLATGNPPRILVRYSGPAYGSNMDSFRAEAYGLLPLTTFLHLLSTSFQQPLPLTELWCDNLAVVNTINRVTSKQHPELPNDTLRPSWDDKISVPSHLSHCPMSRAIKTTPRPATNYHSQPS
jgi:hypothetical protein